MSAAVEYTCGLCGREFTSSMDPADIVCECDAQLCPCCGAWFNYHGQVAKAASAQEPQPAPASPDLACTVCEATGSPHGVPQPAADVELHVLVAERNQLRMALERLARDGNLEARDSLANILPSRLTGPEPAPELAAAKPDLRTAWRLADERLALLGEILGHPGIRQVPPAVRTAWHKRAGLPS